MIHHFYVGHFERDRGVMKLKKRESDGAPRPVVVRPLDMATVQDLLKEKGVEGTNIPEEWWLGMEEEGFIVCERDTHVRDAIDFVRKLARKTGCDIVYDGMLFVSPDELTFAWDENNGRFTEKARASTGAFSPDQWISGQRQQRVPFVVLDQHLWSDQKTMEDVVRRCQNESLGILLPAVAFYELAKHHRAFPSWKMSLKHLSHNAQLVSAGRSIGEMMSEEVESGVPVRDIIDHAVTSQNRLVLIELKNNKDSLAEKTFHQLDSYIDQEINRREHPETNESIVTILLNQWSQTLPPSDVKLLRLHDESVFLRIMAEWETASVVFHAAKNDGCTDEAALALTLGPSVYGHMVYGLMALALDRLAESGQETSNFTEATDKLYCLDYICSATFCADFITQDKRAKRLYSLLTKVFQRRAEMVQAIGSSGLEDQPDKENVIQKIRRPRFNVPWRLAA